MGRAEPTAGSRPNARGRANGRDRASGNSRVDSGNRVNSRSGANGWNGVDDRELREEWGPIAVAQEIHFFQLVNRLTFAILPVNF